MPFNTFSVATAVTPSVIETYFSHYFNRSPVKGKPTAHISYHEGLRLIRQFLEYSSKHGVEDLQAFTAQWVPAPTWVRIHDNEVAPQFLERAARLVQAQLGRRGLEKVGGPTWWQWRRPNGELKAEWIEMKKDFNERRRAGTKCDRCILYVHGGAYYFGSVDEHRYQMQRHARKLKARVLAPRYRLAPQFPFPCGLYDCIATYLYLLEHFRPEQILFAGDSAGGGMVVSMLVTLRDQGIPLPAGTILLSPWVDLTHSFPSVSGDGVGDYIPPSGFHHKPTLAWPPPPNDEIRRPTKTFERPPIDAVEMPDTEIKQDSTKKPSNPRSPSAQVPGLGENLRITIDGKVIELKEQIQLYAPNDMLSHPLVSPVMQPSLGGLPPMLVQVGGAELLHDEQVYLAHKAANPQAYPPSDAVLDEYDRNRELLNRYPPTDVQLQVWEDLCHVPHTLSFTRPAKYMYRSVAQFGAWALAHAQQRGIDIPDDDVVSIISSGGDDGSVNTGASTTDLKGEHAKSQGINSEQTRPVTPLVHAAVGKAGDPLPPFENHMIRQRVTRHGIIYPLAPQSEIAILALDPASIGAIKPGPVRKWLAKHREMDAKFANEKKKVQKKRAKEIASGLDVIPGETPPASALVGRRRKGVVPEGKKQGKSWGLAMWSGWGSHHDEETLDRGEKLEQDTQRAQPGASAADLGSIAGTTQTVEPRASNAPPSSSSLGVPGVVEADEGSMKRRRTSGASFMSSTFSRQRDNHDRPRSASRQVVDAGQAGNPDVSPLMSGATIHVPYSRRSSVSTGMVNSRPVSVATPATGSLALGSVLVPGSQNTYLDPNGNRPHNGVMAYPFKLRNPLGNPSIATLDSQASSPANGDFGPVEMPTPADERSVVSSLQDRTEPASTPPQEENVAPGDTMPSPRPTPVSPIDGSNSSSLRSRKQPVFDNRTSVLGPIGADGLPTAPLVARKITSENRDQHPLAQSSQRVPPTGSAPISPIDGPAATLFKVRNPAIDPRLDSPTPSSPSTTLGPGEATEATKTAPFKLRHTVLDSKVAPATKNPAPTDHSHAELTAARAMTPTTTEPLPPNAHVVMPTLVTRRPAARTMTPPPPQPPPKDDPAAGPPGYREKHGGYERRPSDRKVLGGEEIGAPRLGELKFELGGLGEVGGGKE